MKRRIVLALSVLFLGACATAGPPVQVAPLPASACAEVQPVASYQPKPAYAGPQPALPSAASYVSLPLKLGDAYTVRGAGRRLRSRVFSGEVTGKQISVVGYIVKTNYDEAPACAVHRVGLGDPQDCHSPLPSFSIADEKGDVAGAMLVMGWASNFAQIFTLIENIDRAPKGKAGDVRHVDEFWGNPLPNPLPNVGAKVKVTGTYGVTFTRATSGTAADPRHGIMTVERVEYLDPPQKVYLPGMKTK